jgi:hypothetical protein
MLIALLPITKELSLELKDLVLISTKSVLGCCKFKVTTQFTIILALKNGKFY